MEKGVKYQPPAYVSFFFYVVTHWCTAWGLGIKVVRCMAVGGHLCIGKFQDPSYSLKTRNIRAICVSTIVGQIFQAANRSTGFLAEWLWRQLQEYYAGGAIRVGSSPTEVNIFFLSSFTRGFLLCTSLIVIMVTLPRSTVSIILTSFGLAQMYYRCLFSSEVW